MPRWVWLSLFNVSNGDDHPLFAAQDIDLMCVDGAVAVTSSLDGDVRVWDLHPMKRRCVRVISRR